METAFSLKPHHVAINVKDIDSAIAWYGEILGFEVEKRNFIRGFRGQNALIKHGDFRIELFQNENILPRPEEPVHAAGTEMLGYRQLAFTVDDLQKLTQSLEKKNADIAMKRQDGTVLFLRDNSGNVLEFMPPV